MSSLPRIMFSKILAGLLLGLLVLNNPCARADDVLGCGGYVRSENNADIDFKQIVVKLYTKSGSLKGQIECAPNTGYYFLPVYDKGEYVLKLEPPRGWSFNATKVELNIDGSEEDHCSQGRDINFFFTGFGITGKVVAATKTKTASQLKGISVSLHDQHNKSRLGLAVTSDDGVFSFTPIQPGKYVLVASHPSWLMEKHSTVVTVKEGNTIVKDGELSVFGFDVSGRVTTTEGEPVGKVYFLLFGNGQTKNCAITPVEGYNKNQKPLCHVSSDETGRFLFPAVSPGEYTLVPHYAGEKTKFDVNPAEYSFTVNEDSVVLPVEFKVTKFTITGKVLASAGSLTPVVGAKVYMSKKLVGTTDKNGVYKVDDVKVKQYTLYAEADDLQFEEVSVKVSPSNPELPVLTPVAYKVTGKLSSTTKENLQKFKVLIKKVMPSEGSLEKEVEVDQNSGEWSVYLAPAKYHINVMVGNKDKIKDMQFFPLQKVIDVKSAPLKDIYFLQRLRGSIVCLPDKDTKKECNEIEVTLKMVNGIIETKIGKAKEGQYVFEDVLPGQYEVTIDTNHFCWENSKHQITIESEKPFTVPPFKQTGYSVTFSSSHETKIEYSLPSQPNKKLSFQLPKGITNHCLPESGKYNFYPKGCHKYVKPFVTLHTNERTPVMFSSNEHLVSGSILSSVAVAGISVKIETEIDAREPLVLENLKTADTKGEVYKYSFSFNSVTGVTYVITPSSEALLFSPASIRISGPEDCQTDAVIFQAEKGKIISGSVSPPIDGVSITILRNDEELIHELITKQDGSFKVGPLDGSIDYVVVAKKDGYIITRDANSNNYNFLVRKLAEINVQVVDAADSIPLQGVLISLSGGGSGHSYRKNIVTGEDGKLTFNSLSPGDYYLRPTMKEYRFEPTSKMIRVEEGKSVLVSLVGRRVAFSAYGVVTCLNGEPEAGLVVEARGQVECSDLQEEATTKEDGTWRIRGLEPKCIYAIRLKLNEKDPNSRGLRAIPSSVAVQATQDVYNIKLMALQPVSRTDISVRVTSSQPENYRTLRVRLCREESPDSPIHVAKLDSQLSSKQQQFSSAGYLLHLPSLQVDGKRYFVQLDTTLSRSNYDYQIAPVYFEANSSFKYVKLHFDADRRHDHADGSQITLVPLPLIILVTLAFFKRDSISSWLNTAVEKWSSNKKSSPSVSKKAQDVAQSQVATNDSKLEELIAEQLRNINAKSTSKKVKPRKA
ncbi:nodal modulator 1 [Copidosoma floridanum]|uniref:nodal modulator 1 n=1 Tax=Copidosoma floridanum TaxID=29053 RepID=UPI0006C9DFEC|nr:nodal modulator 1 [Copidosoma floridanum]